MARIFVYGTLRAGGSAHHVIAPYAREIWPARTTGRLYALPGGYPGLVADPEGEVRGDLVRLDDAERAFAHLDAYEGDEYVRQRCEVQTHEGRVVKAWVYALIDARMARDRPLIESGDWAEYTGRAPGP